MIGSLKKHITVDNFEATFQINYLGHFLLTQLLLGLLKKSAPSRVIFVSSASHYIVKFNRKILSGDQYYNPVMSYPHSKLAVLLYAKELSRQLENCDVTVNSLHPGEVNSSGILRNLPTLKFLYKIVPFIFLTPHEGAQTQIKVAIDPDLKGITGQYFSQGKVAQPSRYAQNEDDSIWLYKESLKMTDLMNY